MSKVVLHYQQNKLQQCMNFFASKTNKPLNNIWLGKLIYLAERLHLRRYARLISDVDYVFTPGGIFPTQVLGLVETIGKFNPYFLSDSDCECLQDVWDRFGSFYQSELINTTSLYLEYRLAELRVHDKTKETINIKDFLLEPGPSAIELCPLTDEDRKLTIDMLDEASSINLFLHGG
jgi:hypothetical protein